MKKFVLLFAVIILISAFQLPMVLSASKTTSHTSFGSDILFKPEQIIVKNNEIFVLDKGDKNIKIFSANGKLENTIGGYGVGPGEFNLPTNFQIYNNEIQVLDTNQQKIHVFSLKTKKYLTSRRYILTEVYKTDGPYMMTKNGNGNYFFGAVTSLKGEKVITRVDKNNKYRPLFQFLNSIPVANSMDELFKQGPQASHFKNFGYMAASKDNIYFGYYLYNYVMKFSEDGKLVDKYIIPLESIDKKAKMITLSNGASYLERRLVYDLKVKNNILYLLARTENGNSIIYELNDGVFEERFNTKEPLDGFDISDGKLFGFEKEESVIHVYSYK